MTLSLMSDNPSMSCQAGRSQRRCRPGKVSGPGAGAVAASSVTCSPPGCGYLARITRRLGGPAIGSDRWRRTRRKALCRPSDLLRGLPFMTGPGLGRSALPGSEGGGEFLAERGTLYTIRGFRAGGFAAGAAARGHSQRVPLAGCAGGSPVRGGCIGWCSKPGDPWALRRVLTWLLISGPAWRSCRQIPVACRVIRANWDCCFMVPRPFRSRGGSRAFRLARRPVRSIRCAGTGSYSPHPDQSYCGSALHEVRKVEGRVPPEEAWRLAVTDCF